jgi:hypothetical protein
VVLNKKLRLVVQPPRLLIRLRKCLPVTCPAAPVATFTPLTAFVDMSTLELCRRSPMVSVTSKDPVSFL